MHTLHLRTCMLMMHMLTSSGALATSGWEAGVKHLGSAENLEAAKERGLKPAAEGFGPTADLAAAAAYDMR